jgi:DNA adenine methylase
MNISRPINWYGSKQKMAPVIHRMIPDGPNTWVDVFCGSAIVTLAKPRHPREVINDRDGDIVTLFHVLRDPALLAELNRRIELTPYAEELLDDAYATPVPEEAVARAHHFLIRSWFGRGGDSHQTGFRWSKRQTTSPEIIWARLPERLRGAADRLRGVCVRNDDALKIVADYDHPDCVLFLDPPYPGAVGRRYAVKMTLEEHWVLAERLRGAKASVILTMNPGTVYGEMLEGWQVTEVSVQGGGNQFKTEHILTNFAPLPLFRTREGSALSRSPARSLGLLDLGQGSEP